MVMQLKRLLRTAASLTLAIGMIGMGWLSLYPHEGQFAEFTASLPPSLQPLARIALILLCFVVPFALMVFVHSAEKKDA